MLPGDTGTSATRVSHALWEYYFTVIRFQALSARHHFDDLICLPACEIDSRVDIFSGVRS